MNKVVAVAGGTSEYLYCFDAEWQPGMAGVAVNPMDPTLGIPWPLAPVLSDKDASAPGLAPGRKERPQDNRG